MAQVILIYESLWDNQAFCFHSSFIYPGKILQPNSPADGGGKVWVERILLRFSLLIWGEVRLVQMYYTFFYSCSLKDPLKTYAIDNGHNPWLMTPSIILWKTGQIRSAPDNVL